MLIKVHIRGIAVLGRILFGINVLSLRRSFGHHDLFFSGCYEFDLEKYSGWKLSSFAAISKDSPCCPTETATIWSLLHGTVLAETYSKMIIIIIAYWVHNNLRANLNKPFMS